MLAIQPHCFCQTELPFTTLKNLLKIKFNVFVENEILEILIRNKQLLPMI